MNWDDIADAYLSISEDRDRIISPFLAKLINETGCRTLADIGGGDGRFLELALNRFGESHFTDMALTDTSNRMLARARARLEEHNNITIAEKPCALPKKHWGMITLIAVWMSLETEEACVALLREINELLIPGGKLVAAVTHPCFRGLNFHSFSANFDLSDYFRSGKQFRVNLYDSARSLAIWDTHWSLSDHTRQLNAAGFVIEHIAELPDVDVSSEGAPWLIFVATPK